MGEAIEGRAILIIEAPAGMDGEKLGRLHEEIVPQKSGIEILTKRLTGFATTGRFYSPPQPGWNRTICKHRTLTITTFSRGA
ncbi:MAG: hypothetical protein H8D67_08860 [Deltaproteobacteria bacterium]|nr:hypothetical protein [Deltaproteobacteria bacterium]